MNKLVFLLLAGLIVFVTVLGVVSAVSPVMNNVSVLPSVAFTNDTLLGFCNASDGDGDNLTYEWAWFNGSTELSSGNEYGYLVSSDSLPSNNYYSLTNNGTDWFVGSRSDAKIYLLNDDFTVNSTFIDTSSECLYIEYGLSYYDGFFYVSCSSFTQDVVKYNSSGDYTGSFYDADVRGLYVNSSYVYALQGDTITKLYHNLSSSGSTITLSGAPTSDFFDLTVIDDLFVISAKNDAVAYVFYLNGTYKDIILNSVDDYGLHSNSTHLFGVSSSKLSTYEFRKTHTQGVSVNVVNLSSSSFVRDDNVSFSCRSFDGVSYSSWLNSSVLTVSNTVPTTLVSNISPSVIYANQSINGFCKVSDLDESTIRANFSFYRNGTFYSSGYSNIPTDTLYNTVSSSRSWAVKGDTWIFSCWGEDSDSVGVAVNSSPVTILNSFPVINSVNLSPVAPQTTDNISFVNSSSDVDGDGLTYWFKWFVDGVENNSFENVSLINSDNTSLDEVWLVSLNVFDGTSWSGWFNSSSVMIGDSVAPVLSNDSLSSSSGVDDSPFTVSVNVSDSSGLSYVYVGITDPNGDVTNYSMSPGLVSGLQSYVYTPGIDGVYSFDFYVMDVYNNSANLSSVLSYAESTSVPVVVGGGGSTTVVTPVKSVCNIGFSPDTVFITESGELFDIVLFNNDNVSWSPDSGFVDVDGLSVFSSSSSVGLSVSNPAFTLLPGRSSSFGVSYVGGVNVSGFASLVLSSDNCADVVIPVVVDFSQVGSVTDLFSDFDLLGFFGEPVGKVGTSFYDEAGFFTVGLLSLFVGLFLLLVFGRFLGDKLKSKSFGGFTIGLLFVLVATLLVTILIVGIVKGGL